MDTASLHPYSWTLPHYIHAPRHCLPSIRSKNPVSLLSILMNISSLHPFSRMLSYF
jgi:hypothetical protein